MKRFIIRLSLLIVPLSLLGGVLLVLAYRSEMSALRRSLTFSNEIRAAVVGDSRVEVYFDPDEIPWLANCGQSATPFQITAAKAKIIVEQNPNLEFIVVDFWPSKLFDNAKSPFAPYVPSGVAMLEISNRHNMPALGDDFPLRLSQGVFKPGLRRCLGQNRSKSSIAGGFMRNEKFLASNKWARIETYSTHRMYELEKTPLSMELVLEELLQWMKNQNMKVILTSTPIYHLWWEYYYSKAAQEYFEKRVAEIADRYDVPWYNWLHEYQDCVDYWADGDHLNHIGAKVFSRDKRVILERHLRPRTIKE